MFFKSLTLGNMDNNCYIIADEDTKDAAVIDAPCDADSILEVLKENGLTCKYILLTHSHFDHVGALQALKDATDAKVVLHTDEVPMLTTSTLKYFKKFGIKQPPVSPDILLKDGDNIELGGITIKALHTPGHTPGGVCYLTEESLFSGDTLFKNDIGRCDLPGGHYGTILKSIREKLYTLPGKTKVYPGHGEFSTIEHEKQHNNYIRQGWEYEY